jgi:hypothetical protein
LILDLRFGKRTKMSLVTSSPTYEVNGGLRSFQTGICPPYLGGVGSAGPQIRDDPPSDFRLDAARGRGKMANNHYKP